MQLRFEQACDDYCRRIGEAFYPVQIDRVGKERPVVTRFSTTRRGWLRVTRGSVITNAPVHGRRDWRDIEAGTPDEFLLMGAVSTSLAYEQFGRRAEILPGFLALLDARTPYNFERLTAGAVVCHHLPGWVLREAVRTPEDLCAMPIDGRRGMGATLKALVNVTSQQMGVLSEPERCALLGSVATLLPLSCRHAERSRRSARPVRTPPFSRAMQYIEENIEQSDLRARTVASAVGISLSHLHALAARSGTTIGAIILERRLDLCARALASPVNADTRITDIAFRYGFNDAAHFSRAFKRKFGLAARDFRKRPIAVV